MIDTKQLIQELSAQATPVKAVRPHVWASRLIAVLLVYAGAAQWWLGIRPDLATQLERSLFIAELFLLAAMLISAAIASVLAMVPDTYQKKNLLKLPYIISGLMLALVTFQLLMPQDARMVMPDETSHTIECAMFIAMASMLPAALIFVLLRKGATIMPKNAGALAVIASASIGALTLRLAEADDYIIHLLTWHYIPSILFAGLGALIGRWMLRW